MHLGIEKTLLFLTPKVALVSKPLNNCFILTTNQKHTEQMIQGGPRLTQTVRY